MSPLVILFIFLFVFGVSFYASLVNDYDKVDSVLPNNCQVIGVFDEPRTTDIDGERITTGRNYYLQVQCNGGRQYLLQVDEHVYQSYKIGFDYADRFDEWKDKLHINR